MHGGKLFELENVQLTFADDSLAAIAKKAIERKSGARGLRSILENIMLDLMFEIPSIGNVAECVVSEELILKGASPLLIYEKQAESA